MLHRLFTGMMLDWGWTEIVPASGSEPSGDRGGALFTRNGTGKFVLVGGRTQAGSDLSDLWTFDYGGTDQWTQVVASGLTNVQLPSGYADGSGNILINTGHVWDSSSASTAESKISVSTGTQTALTDSGTGAASETAAHMTADIANKRLWVGRIGGSSYTLGYYLTKATQNTTANTSVKVQNTTSNTSKLAATSLAYHPDSDTLYTMVANVAWNGGTWTLNTGCIYKYDIAAGTGWANVTGVTNSAGGIIMPAWPANNGQMIWCASEAKFFIFIGSNNIGTPGGGGLGRVLTFDPVTKVITEVLFSGTPPAYILSGYDEFGAGRGNCGTVVNTGSDFFFITAWGYSSLTNARIWKFART